MKLLSNYFRNRKWLKDYSLRVRIEFIFSCKITILRCSVWTDVFLFFSLNRDARWHDGESAMTRWYDDENAMVRWWKRDGTMVKTRWHDGTMVKPRYNIAFSSSYHRVFTIVPSWFRHRTIAFSSSCHRLPVIMRSESSWYASTCQQWNTALWNAGTVFSSHLIYFLWSYVHSFFLFGVQTNLY